MSKTDPNGPSSWPQAMLIKKLSKGQRDIRGENLTYQQASDLIDTLKSGQPVAASQPLDEVRVNRVSYRVMMSEAVKAANVAGDQWLSTAKPKFNVVQRANPLDDNSPIIKDYGPMLDVCGHVFIHITDHRTGFSKWITKRQKGYNTSVMVPHKYKMRQEMGLLEACEGAALKVFTNYGIKGIQIYARID